MYLEGRGVVLETDFSENGLDDREISPVGAKSKGTDVSLALGTASWPSWQQTCASSVPTFARHGSIAGRSCSSQSAFGFLAVLWMKDPVRRLHTHGKGHHQSVWYTLFGRRRWLIS